MSHYAPYGEVWGEQGTAQTPFGYTGEPTDQNGLVQLRARYYNPTLGVFPSLDPMKCNPSRPMSLNRYSYVQGNPVNDAVGELMGMNRYSYANNNPVNLTDPSGMIAERPEQWDTCNQRDACVDACFNTPLFQCMLRSSQLGPGSSYSFYARALMQACQVSCRTGQGPVIPFTIPPQCMTPPTPTVPPTNTPPSLPFRLPMQDARLTIGPGGCLATDWRPDQNGGKGTRECMNRYEF